MQTLWNLPRIELMPFAEINERRPVLLVTSSPAWQAVKDALHLSVNWRIDVSEATLTCWQALLENLRHEIIQVESAVLYAIGGGLVADAAKFFAKSLDLPLICLPTALTVDAFFTWASGVRQDGCVKYIETKPPEKLVIDFAVLASAPQRLRAAGICDVLSIATGSWDWRFAEERGQNPPGMHYLPWADEAAFALLQAALDCAEAAGSGDPAGLKQLLDCLALEVQLCNQLGHSRPEEGSEHYFAYAAENYAGSGLPHGNLVGPGILWTARLQGQDTSQLEKSLHDCNVPLDGLSASVIKQTLLELPAYCQRHSLPFGIAHTLTQAQIETLSLV